MTMSDQLFKKRTKKEKIETSVKRLVKPYRHLIVCEGEKTEPLYFEHYKKRIDGKYGKTGGIDIIEILGEGKNTVSLVECAEKRAKEARVGFGTIWCVFDKDSFEDEQFNKAITLCKNKGYKAVWSNECIELWFLLHFNYLTAAIDRKSYMEKLNEIFSKKKIVGGRYKKNLEDIHSILTTHGSEAQAIKHARKLENLFDDKTTPSKQKPMTKVYELIEELNSIMND